MQRGLKTAGLLKVLLCAGGCAHSPPAIRSLVEWPKPPSEQPVGVEASGRIQTASFRHSKASLPLDSTDATFNSLDEGGMVEDRSVPVRRNANKNDFNAHLPDLQPDSTTRPLKLEPQASGLHSGPTSDVAEEMASENAVVSPQEVIAVDLQSALSMIGGQQPEVGFARWRVQEAYAEYRQARVLWLPTIQTGFSFHRHDGNYQASNGDIVDVNRNSFQYGLGNGATGAGTTQRPGVVAQFHLTDALFQPAVTQKRAWAAQHTSDAVLNQQLLEAALAYLELLEAYQRRSIVQQTFERTADLAKLTDDFAATGQGLQADADRLATERLMAENRLVAAAEQIDVASARLSEVLSLAYGRTIVPAEPSIVPISFVTPEQDQSTLITTGLTNRPELKSSQALVVAACHAYEREKYAPFIPSVLLGFSTGEFGGGLGNELNDVEGRYDFDAALTWQARNLGFGEAAARRQSASRVQQAKFAAARTMDQIAREVSAASSQVRYRSERMKIAEQAISVAQDSFERNLSRIRDGQGLPLEVLQSVTALDRAQLAYLDAVVAFNRAQFRLQWSLGWPVTAPDDRFGNRDAAARRSNGPSKVDRPEG